MSWNSVACPSSRSGGQSTGYEKLPQKQTDCHDAASAQGHLSASRNDEYNLFILYLSQSYCFTILTILFFPFLSVIFAI